MSVGEKRKQPDSEKSQEPRHVAIMVPCAPSKLRLEEGGVQGVQRELPEQRLER